MPKRKSDAGKVSKSVLERARYALLDAPASMREALVHELEWSAIFRLEDRIRRMEHH